MGDYFLIAEIVDLFDSKGSVIIKSFSDFPERFLKLKKVYVDYFGKKKELIVESVKEVNAQFVVKFERFDNIEDIQFLINNKLYVDSDNLYELPDDFLYIHDLIDCKVYMNDVFFGILIDILKFENNDVYVISNNDGEEILVPAVGKFFDSIVIEEKKIFLSKEAEIFNNEN